MRKRKFIVLSGLSLGLVALSSVSAEPFNSRGEDWLRTIPPSQQAIIPTEDRLPQLPQSFNNRGEDWLAAVSPGEGPVVRLEVPLAMFPQRFNRK